MKASDITDEQVYEAIDRLMKEKSIWAASLWDLQAAFAEYPPKLVQAKLRIMVKRKRLEGCACGCRGDFCRSSNIPY